MITPKYSAHTPGPWEADEPSSGVHRRIFIRRVGENVNGGAHACVFAVDGTATAYGTQDANASLIAAAPDLLEALETLVQMCEQVVPDHIATNPDHDYGQSDDAARAAIAKARGEEAAR